MVDSLNLHRRHLTQEQKHERIEALLKATPERSDNATAKLAKVGDKGTGRTFGDSERLQAHRHQRARAAGAQGPGA